MQHNTVESTNTTYTSINDTVDDSLDDAGAYAGYVHEAVATGALDPTATATLLTRPSAPSTIATNATTVKESKKRDEEDPAYQAQMGAVADRNALTQRFDAQADAADTLFTQTVQGVSEMGLDNTTITPSKSNREKKSKMSRESTPEAMASHTQAEVRTLEESVKRSFRDNLNIDHIDIPAVREARRLESKR